MGKRSTRQGAHADSNRVARELKEERRHRQILFATSVGSVAALMGVFVAVLVWAPWRTPTQGSASTTAVPARPQALAVTAAWPWVTGCPANGSNVAMPVGGGSINDFHAPTGLTKQLVASGAGSWGYGQLYVDLAAKPGQSVEIVGLNPHIDRRDLAAPAWIYIPTAGCGPNAGDRVFKLNLDKPRLVDTGLEAAPGDVHPSDAPTAPLGPGFVLTGTHHARIRVDAYSCDGNYEWTVQIQYIVTGQPGVRTVTLGPFRSYGLADNTVEYIGRQDDTGHVIGRHQVVTGPDRGPACI